MTTLTADQIRQLNMYSVYIDPAKCPIFTAEDLLHPAKTGTIIETIKTISGSPNLTVAASFFMRRAGMFIAMQFYNMAAYDEMWIGSLKNIQFGAIEEYGNKTISTFISTEDWEDVDDGNRTAALRSILLMSDRLIRQIRTITTVSPLTLWENIFGFLLWQYHVLLSNPGTAEEAGRDLAVLKADSTWEGIASHSLFSSYLKGSEPSALLNTEVRTTCCFSKDVPGLMQCGFCPLK